MGRTRSRGNLLILTSLAMFASLAMAALAIDWGIVYFARHQLQNFVDAAALAGAQELPSGGVAKQKASENYSQNYASNFKIPTPPPQIVTCPPDDPDLQPTTTCYRIGEDFVHITTPYQRTGDPSPNPNLINVKACRVVPLFFARILGATQIRVCAKATAIGSRPQIARGLVVLDPNGGNALLLQGNARLRIPNGVVIVDSSANDALFVQGNASLIAHQIAVVGNYQIQGNASVIPIPLTGQPPTPDPLAQLSPPDPSGLPVFPGRTIRGNDAVTLQPGVYEGPVRVEGNAKVILQPGIYILKGGLLVSGNSQIEGEGVLIYNESGRIEVQGNGKVKLSAQTGGTYEGIVIFQSRTNAQPIWLSGNAEFNVTGAIYAPSAQIHFEGNTNLRDSMVVAYRVGLFGNVEVKIEAKEPPVAGGEVAIGLVE
ncbi:MAG: pilus assembly protein TadG-related protein [Candidatus Fervidibacter sp.]|uniref:pilus assembly protein TadG-related protein n=1 Tax=Candidatus Fervidibacter sp. TaxID=3100871 RepID=UPI00404B7F0B